MTSHFFQTRKSSVHRTNVVPYQYYRLHEEQNDTVNSLAASGNKMEEELRRRLAFHFMDPVDKFIARRQVPWKLLLQFLKGIIQSI